MNFYCWLRRNVILPKNINTIISYNERFNGKKFSSAYRFLLDLNASINSSQVIKPSSSSVND